MSCYPPLDNQITTSKNISKNTWKVFQWRPTVIRNMLPRHHNPTGHGLYRPTPCRNLVPPHVTLHLTALPHTPQNLNLNSTTFKNGELHTPRCHPQSLRLRRRQPKGRWQQNIVHHQRNHHLDLTKAWRNTRLPVRSPNHAILDCNVRDRQRNSQIPHVHRIEGTEKQTPNRKTHRKGRMETSHSRTTHRFTGPQHHGCCWPPQTTQLPLDTWDPQTKEGVHKTFRPTHNHIQTKVKQTFKSQSVINNKNCDRLSGRGTDRPHHPPPLM